LGWDEERIETINLAAPMHDVGKVGIPDIILLKPGKLTPDEWEIMKKHSQYGYDILKGADSELLQMASVVALEHHEKWDGSGYPNQLRGEGISIYGRLTALADVFDALTSKRPYKESWSFEKTKDHIYSQSGIHFDPELTKIFLDLYSEMVKIKEEYIDEE